jgi:hypothetical protein
MGNPTPAEIANDMSAHAAYWRGRDRKAEALCRDAAVLIRSMLAGRHVDGRTYHGVWRRLLDSERKYYAPKVQGWPKFGRARSAIEALKKIPSNGL